MTEQLTFIHFVRRQLLDTPDSAYAKWVSFRSALRSWRRVLGEYEPPIAYG
jgi:hypothetical protein